MASTDEDVKENGPLLYRFYTLESQRLFKTIFDVCAFCSLSKLSISEVVAAGHERLGIFSH